MSDPSYAARYCAFVDILGFKELVDAVERDNLPFTDLRDALRTVRTAGHDRGYMPKLDFADADLRYQNMSDSICLSSSNNDAGLLQLLWSIQYVCLTLLQKGYFARGAIVKGKLYHDDNMVFGAALARAYGLEQNVVRFPRIMLARDVALDVEHYASSPERGGYFENTVSRDEDGPHFFHVLRGLMILHEQALDPRGREAIVARFNETADLIQK
jgi:hypothetical protein